MINVQVDEEKLLDLLMQRMEYWIKDANTLNLYEQYLKDLIDGGCFEGANLDISLLIDNLYVNDTQIMDKKDLENNDVDINNSEKVLAIDVDNDLYLVTSY